MAVVRFFEAKTDGTSLKHTLHSLSLNEGIIQAVICSLQKLETELKDKNPKNSYIDCQFELSKLIFALFKFMEVTKSEENTQSLQGYCSKEFVKKITGNEQPITMQDLFDIMTSGIKEHNEAASLAQMGAAKLGL